MKLGIEDPEQWLEDCPDRVYHNWHSMYVNEPFGGETVLLTRIVSLLYLVAAKGNKMDAVINASDRLMQLLMPNGWGDRETASNELREFDADAAMQSFTAAASIMEKVF